MSLNLFESGSRTHMDEVNLVLEIIAIYPGKAKWTLYCYLRSQYQNLNAKSTIAGLKKVDGDKRRDTGGCLNLCGCLRYLTWNYPLANTNKQCKNLI